MKSALKGFGTSALGIAASLVLGWLVIRGLEWGDVVDSFQGVSVPLVALAFVVFLLASVLRAIRWQMLFTEKRVSTMRLFIVQNEGIGLNNLVPVRIASELAQLTVLSLRDGVRVSTAVATLGMERVLDLVASASILAVAFFGLAFFFGGPEMEVFTPVVVGLLVISVAAVMVVPVLAWGGSGAAVVLKRLPFLADMLKSLSQALKDLGRSPGRLASASALTLLYWILVGITGWLVAQAVDVQISPIVATLVILGSIFFATSVPGAPSAIGTFEFAVVGVLRVLGLVNEDNEAAAFGFAVITHAVFFLPSTVIAAVFLPREGLGSIRTVRRTLFKSAESARAGNETHA